MEASRLGNPTDFTRVKTSQPDPQNPFEAENSGMFKLIATASNMHLTIADFYEARGEKSKSTYHLELANRLRAESNKFKNVKTDTPATNKVK